MGHVLAAGVSGFLGTSLVAALREAGHEVTRLVRRPDTSADELTWDPSAGQLPPGALDGVSAVINLAGAGVGDKRWSAARKQVLVTSRVAATSLLARALAATGRPEVPLINASAVGFYGDRGEETITTADPPGGSFLAGVCAAWEAATGAAKDAGHRVVHLRTGIVLDPSGGALQQLMLPLKAGVAGPIAGGRQWWPWITREDWVRAVVHLVEADVSGPVHLSAPHPRRNAEVITALARALHRPAVLPIPLFAVRLVAGEFAGELAISQRILPEQLLADGFEFTWPELEPAAEHLLSS
ncbi:TIGR01777 family oxidoreductase [Ruania albidiflava]|uniref:TIGR01777 family oxidoreductase n=1 Tax=Ruania albidiflava TaxID=366586 RepID=UPI0003B50E90|nr:TIGR01777 family oxidoreductase [Ruania albidiflava]